MLKKTRAILAIVSFVLITLLFLDFTGTIHSWFSWLAKIQFLPALLALHFGVVALLIAATLIFGRIYCSVICPLGIMQDVVSKIASKQKKNRFRYSKAMTWLRVTLLVLFAAAIILGLNSFVVILAPYSSYGRIASNILAPIWQSGNNLLAYFAERVDSYAFYSVDIWIKSISTLAVAIVSFLVITYLAWRGGRTYCNTICPVGTLLGYIAKFSYLKPYFDMEKCNSCGLCAMNCKASCISAKDGKIDYTRCVTCFNCIEKCNKGAIKYDHPAKVKAEQAAPKSNESRKKFVATSLVVASAAVAKAQEMKVDGGLAAIINKKVPKRQTPIVPAGAQGIKHFSSKCTACQLCVSVCPNKVLRPSMELDRFMQPEMSYEKGYCRPECNLCSEVCPAGAIERVTREEKSSVQIGHAVWIPKNCVVLTDNVSCGNCAKHCPAGAITMVPSDPKDSNSPKIPSVNTERCIGCGACENLCPATPFSAIYVEGNNRHIEF